MNRARGSCSRTRTPNPELRTLNPEPRTLNPEPRTLNPEPRTLNPCVALAAIAAAWIACGAARLIEHRHCRPHDHFADQLIARAEPAVDGGAAKSQLSGDGLDSAAQARIVVFEVAYLAQAQEGGVQRLFAERLCECPAPQWRR